MSVTIKDVARAAGVSVATVSRVLNNSSAVSAATVENVERVIKEMDYSPNFLGRNLRKCETKNILVVVPSAQQTVYSDIIRGIQDGAGSEYDILIGTSYSYLQTEMRLLNMLFNRTVDAAILMGTQLDADTLNDLNARYSIALCCERVEGAHVLTVTSDNEGGAYEAVSIFAKKGLRRIGIVSTTIRALTSVDRERGYLRALADNGIEPDEELIYRCTYDFEDGFGALDYFMGLDQPVQAVFCISDLLAVGMIKQASKRGVEIGESLQICGFDNISLGAMYIPELTTVAQPGYEMGKTVITKLLGKMSSGAVNNETIMLPYKIIHRSSADLRF